MRIIGKDGKDYESVKACEEADKAYDDKFALEKAEAEKLDASRKDRANDIDKTFAEYVDLQKQAKKKYNEYVDKRDTFVKDYGYFHQTYRNAATGNLSDMFDDMISLFGGVPFRF